MWKRKKKYSPVKYDGDLSKEYNRVLKDISEIERLSITPKLIELNQKEKKIEMEIILTPIIFFVSIIIIGLSVDKFIPRYSHAVSNALLVILVFVVIFLIVKQLRLPSKYKLDRKIYEGKVLLSITKYFSVNSTDYIKMLKSEVEEAISKTAKDQNEKWGTIGHIVSVVILSGLTSIIIKLFRYWPIYLLISLVVVILITISFKNDINNWNLMREVTKKKYQNREKIRKYLQEVLYAKEKSKYRKKNYSHSTSTTNQQIIEALNNIQKEIADLNYPKKIKEKLRERN